MMATTNGTLGKCEVKFANKSACCVIMASGGYPEAYESGFEINMADEVFDSVFVAGAKLDGEKLLTAGGRVLGVTAVADDLISAIDAAYVKVSKVSFNKAHFRHDIGARARKALEGN
jgi:phosphoribosylamine--glycine ligase